MRVAAREIAASRADVRHEQRIADKDRISNLVSHVGGCMSWHMNRPAGQAADGKRRSVVEQVVELRPVEPELRFQIEEFLEHPLYTANVLAYCYLATQAALQVWRGRHVVGVRMRLENPLDTQFVRAHKRNDLISTCRRCPPRLGVVVQH